MKLNGILISSFVLIISACEKPAEVMNKNATLEATVGYYLAEMAAGGEVDPSGFVLSNPSCSMI